MEGTNIDELNRDLTQSKYNTTNKQHVHLTIQDGRYRPACTVS